MIFIKARYFLGSMLTLHVEIVATVKYFVTRLTFFFV